MTKKQINFKETIIIGGGIAGIFLCDAFIKKSYKSFLLIEQNRNFGGYALRGNMKVGLLPAGKRTKDLLEPGIYEYFQTEFINQYKTKLKKPMRKSSEIDFDAFGFENKYYESLILEQSVAKEIITGILCSLTNQILHKKISKINFRDGYYQITFNDKSTFNCKHLIIASGRCYPTIKILKKLGQKYSRIHDSLVGCRATFDSKESKKLFNYQVDFKVKDCNSTYQTYCFNYRGDIQNYIYNNKKIYSGCLNEKKSLGNCFIGKRIDTDPELILKKLKKPTTISYSDLISSNLPNAIKSNFQEMILFLSKFEKITALKFKNFYFPALEQFWHRPDIDTKSLESRSLSNVFFIGDASGISFGVLQCYITANVLLKELEKRYVFH